MNQRQTTSKNHPVIARASANPQASYPWDEEDDYDDRWPPPRTKQRDTVPGSDHRTATSDL